jgi:hypothetical protein
MYRGSLKSSRITQQHSTRWLKEQGAKTTGRLAYFALRNGFERHREEHLRRSNPVFLLDLGDFAHARDDVAVVTLGIPTPDTLASPSHIQVKNEQRRTAAAGE